MKYEPLNIVSKNEAQNILDNGNNMQLKLLPLSLGEYCEDWEFAQEVCFKLTDNNDTEVRANAILGLSFIARNHKKLKRECVERLISKVLKTDLDDFSLDRVKIAIEDIYLYMNW